MSSGRWTFRNGQWVDKEELRYSQPHPNRSQLPCPMVIRDHMEPIQGMHDGKIYTSKAALRKSYREGGYIEVGNDTAPLFKQEYTRKDVTIKDIGEAYDKVKNGYKPQPLESVKVSNQLWYED